MDFIKTHRLPDDQYYKETIPKKNIYLHHTVGGSAVSTFNWWMQDPLKIGVAYIVERTGDIYEVFDPLYWCHHLGLKTLDNKQHNQESIGIELASEGALIKRDDKLYAFDGKQLVHDQSVDLGYQWRGFQYFDAYEDKQVKSTIVLVNYLCDRFSIPKNTVAGEKTRFDYPLVDFSGVLTHCNVRSDKTDLNPSFPFNTLFNE